MTQPGEQLYELVVHATGEVRDAEGNLISSEPVEVKSVVTEAQARAIIEGNQS